MALEVVPTFVFWHGGTYRVLNVAVREWRLGKYLDMKVVNSGTDVVCERLVYDSQCPLELSLMINSLHDIGGKTLETTIRMLVYQTSGSLIKEYFPELYQATLPEAFGDVEGVVNDCRPTKFKAY